MDTQSGELNLSGVLAGLERCRSFDGSVEEFWPDFATALGQVPDSISVRIVAQVDQAWKVLASYPIGRGSTHSLTEEVFAALCAQATEAGYTEQSLTQPVSGHLILVHLKTQEERFAAYAEILFPEAPEYGADKLAALFALAADAPRLYQRNVEEQRRKRQFEDMSRALEVLAAVNAHREFTPAVMTLVNEVATRFQSTRVCLGWVARHYIRIAAMSGTDRFERKVELVQRLEAAMEESRDQEEEVIFPKVEGADTVYRDHEAYVRASNVSTVLSVPLRFNGEVCAVLTLEREDGEFTVDDAISLRVIADQLAPGLSELKLGSRWFGRRWADSARGLLAKAVGPRHTWMKIGAISLTSFVIFAAFVPYTYRVKANFIVVPDSLALMPAPFDGFIDEVQARPGDVVATGNLLVAMDDGELKVEEVSAYADLRRFRAEAEQAEAEGAMAEFRVAKELAGQANARLQLARYRLERSEIRAPFEGVLVEGDLRERLGAPVKQGEVLMKFSRLDGLFLEIELPERDIDLLDGSNQGQVAFASRPDLRFPFEIERVEPSAVAGEGSNYFVIRGVLDGQREDWLRPGMTGVAKLDSGKRTLLWRATHRLVDFVRMTLWI